MVESKECIQMECAKSNEPRTTRRVMGASALLALTGYNVVIISGGNNLGNILYLVAI